MISPDISIENEGWLKFDIETIVSACLSSLEAEALDGMRPGEVVLLFTDNDAVHELNREWRGKDKPTNVLSFPAEDFPVPEGEAAPLGDIALALETCLSEADEKDISPEAHLSHLILHGILHLLGYDHISDSDAAEMEDLERRLLARIGIADPYGSAADGESDA